MTKDPEKSKMQRDNKKKSATWNFDYTTIADRLKSVGVKTATLLVGLNLLKSAQPIH